MYGNKYHQKFCNWSMHVHSLTVWVPTICIPSQPASL